LSQAVPKGSEPGFDETHVPQLLDIVWAKMDGYPWWPGIICQRPNSEQYLKYDEKRRVKKVHLQFFDDPVTRGWVHLRCVRV
jgi:DNA mismatch repair protein MSH6